MTHWSFRTLEVDDPLFETAYRWYEEVPGFLRQLQELRGRHDSFEDFVENINTGLNYVGEADGVPKAFVHGEIHDDGTVEGHLMCEAGADLDLVAMTVTYAKAETLKKHRLIVCHVLRRHKSLVEVVRRAGFTDSGMRAFQGVYRGKLQEVLYFVSER